jgi:hypothetical protein
MWLLIFILFFFFQNEGTRKVNRIVNDNFAEYF